MKNLYNQDYYERGVQLGISGYSNYRWLPELTIPMCQSIIKKLDISKDDTVLDYGCAKGYLVKAFDNLGYNCYGADLSNYAIEASDVSIRHKLYLIEHEQSISNMEKYFNFVISKDVFEHIEPSVLSSVISQLSNVCKTLFVITPLGDGSKYIIPEYEKDITHIIREDKEWWSNMFLKNGFTIKEFSYRIPGIKDNWAHYPKGNGFFILESAS